MSPQKHVVKWVAWSGVLFLRAAVCLYDHLYDAATCHLDRKAKLG